MATRNVTLAFLAVAQSFTGSAGAASTLTWDAQWDLQVNTALAATDDLLVTDTFTASLWTGGNTAPLLAPSIVRLTVATIRMTITAAQSATMKAGLVYPVRIYRTRAGVVNCIGVLDMTCISGPR